jgi:acyl-ACP thioesterase
MPAAPSDSVEPLAEEPLVGRVFETDRRVRLGDASPGGRLRFDALVRYLQDVSDDDTRDAGFTEAAGWVVRRTVIEVGQFPVYLEAMTCRTWCSGTGGRWAERRIRVRGERGGAIDSATLWVHVDAASGRPTVLPAEFHALYGPATGGRTVRANLRHHAAPDVVKRQWTWTPRFCDYDVLGHVNNSNYWTVVEEELARRRDIRAPLRAELEHRDALEPGAVAEVTVVDEATGVRVWINEGGAVRASATVDAVMVEVVDEH